METVTRLGYRRAFIGMCLLILGVLLVINAGLLIVDHGRTSMGRFLLVDALIGGVMGAAFVADARHTLRRRARLRQPHG